MSESTYTGDAAPVSGSEEQTAQVEPLSGSARTGVLAYMAISALVFVLMMLLGLLLRMEQAAWLGIGPALFYQVMTAHGAGMVGISGLAASGVLWYFLRRYVGLTVGILWANLVLFLLGVVGILCGIFLFGFGGGWTFLFPLPSHGMGAWGTAGAACYLLGLLSIGVGFLLLYLDVARGIMSKYGSLAKGLGWPQLFGRSDAEMPPATIVASTMVLIINIAGIAAGAVVLTLMLVNLYVPTFAVDALLAKNLIYFFGHVFINATIYQAVIAVYEILPEYAKRPWKVSKVFLAAWTASTLMVLAVYPHHLLMDFVMPTWMLIMGQVISYTSGFPILVVTAYGALTIVYRSGIRWDIVSGLLFLSMFGWAVGVVPAIIDGTIAVNHVMHNTMWVPGHFHMYLIVGLVAMLFGFSYYLANQGGTNKAIDRLAFWMYAIAGSAFCLMFLVSGYASVPRRWAAHMPEWIDYSSISSVIAALVVLAALIFAVRFLTSLKDARTA